MSDEERIEEERLLDLAASIADGEAVDWAAVEGSARGEEKAVLRALQDIAGIAEAHRSWQAEPLASDSADPERWGDLEILGRLGEGSYGDVFRALDPRLDREVALKLLRDDGAEANGDRAVREGRLLARVRHPNVATVYGADRRDGRTGLWMELITGRTLSELVREQGPFSPREAALIALDVCRAIAAVHAQGIVHRDIKAQNVMRATGGRIVLTDFGIGRDLEREDGREEEGSLSGTPLYLAPEIFMGRKASVQSDLYSLGVLLYYLVTGQFPVRGASLADIRRAHEQGEVRLLRDVRPGLPESFVRVVERALSPDPANRYASAGSFEQALSGVLDLDETTVRDRRAVRTQWRGWVYLGLAAAVVIAVVAVWLLYRHLQRKEADELIAQAKVLHAKGEIEGAIKTLERAVDVDPEYPTAYRNLALLLPGAGRFEEALAASNKAFQLHDEDDAEGLRIAGSYYVDRLQYDDALNAYGRAAVLDSQDAATWQEIAMLHANLGRPESGLKQAKRAAEAQPNNVVMRGLRPFLLALANRPDEALSEIERARSEFGNDEDTNYLYWPEGLAWLVLDRPDEAQRAFRRLREGDPTYASWGGLLYSQSLAYDGKLQQAWDELASGLDLDLGGNYQKNEAVRRYRMARLALLLGRPEAARSNLEWLVGLKDVPIFLKDLREAAVLYVELGELQPGRDVLLRIRGLNQHYSSSLSRCSVAQVLGEIQAAEGMLKAAELSFSEARSLRGDPSTLRSLGRFLLSQERYREAIPVFQEILASKGWIMQDFFGGDWVLAHLYLARCQRALGKTADARKSYEQFLALWSDDDLAVVREAREELAALSRSPR